MKPAARKRFISPSGVRVRLQGYPGRPRRRGSSARSLGVVVLIVTVLGVTVVSRHLPRGAGEGKPATAHTGVSYASKPQRRVSAPSSAPSPVVSPEPAVRVQPAAPTVSPWPDGKVGSTGTPRTTTRPVTKAADGTLTTGPGSKVATGESATGAPVLSGGGRRYRVQVGAFADRPPADELATRLRALGYAARVAGVQPFVVLVGGYLDEPTAGRLVSNLQAQGFDAVMNPASTPK